jgi:DNA-binding winged helix-turn-helix (wHTH) protein
MQTTEFPSNAMLHSEKCVRLPLEKDASEPEAFKFGPYCLIPGRRQLLAGEDQIDLGSRAFDILVLLVKSCGDVVTTRQIFEHAWPDMIVEGSNIRGQISDLRRALSTNCRPFIVTVRGRGYVFVVPVQRLRFLEA